MSVVCHKLAFVRHNGATVELDAVISHTVEWKMDGGKNYLSSLSVNQADNAKVKFCFVVWDQIVAIMKIN